MLCISCISSLDSSDGTFVPGRLSHPLPYIVVLRGLSMQLSASFFATTSFME